MSSIESVPTVMLLGGAVIQKGDTPLGGPAAHRHRLALLALLAASDRPVSRDKLIALLWPERDEEQGRNSLKTAVHELRKLLGESSIRSTGDQLSLDTALVRCDVAEFRAALAANEGERAAAVYTGPFLDGFFLKQAPEFERWADTERNRLAAEYARLLETLGTMAEGRGDATAAVRWWRALAAQDRVRSDVALRLMRALAASGDREGAVRYADTHAAFRREDLELDADPAVVRLAGELAATQTPAATGPPAIPGALREPATPPSPAPSSRRWSTAVGTIVVAGLLVMLGGRYLPVIAGAGEGRPGRPDSNVIAILPFRVNGADPSLSYLRNGLAELLAAEFTGEGGARSLDPGTVLRAAGDSQVNLDQAAAVQLAGRLGAGQVLVGGVVGTPRRMTVTASIVSVPGGEQRGPPVIAEGPADSLAAMVSDVSSRLLSRGTGGWRLSANDPGTTSSEALRAFVAGRALYRAGRLNDGYRQYARAIELDSTFVLAAYWLTINGALTRPLSEAGIERAMRLAFQHRARLGPEQRLLLEALLGPRGPGGRDTALAQHLAMERAATQLTASAEAWALLADSYFHRGAMLGYEDWLPRAREAFQRAVGMEMDLGSVSHLATIAFIERDMTAHARWLHELERLAPDHHYTLREQYAAAVVNGTPAQVREARERMIRHGGIYADSYDGNDWVVGLTLPRAEVDSLYATMVRLGSDEQRAQAWRYLVSVERSAGRPSRVVAAVRHYTSTSDLGYISGVVTWAERDSAAAEQLAAHPTPGVVGLERMAEVALSRLRRGDTVGAGATAARLRAVTDPDYPDAHVGADLITAIVASFQPGRVGLDALQRADALLRTFPFGMPPIWNYDLALAFARRGEYRMAATVARRRLLSRSSRLAISLRDEGRWSLLAGDTAAAIRAWDRYLVIRASPEPVVQSQVDSVKAGLALLERNRKSE